MKHHLLWILLLPPALGPMLTTTATGSVVLNELMINPFGSELQGEWIELFHDGPTVDLGGWKVTDQDGHNLSLPSIGFSGTLVLLWIGPPREGALGLNSTMSLLNDSGDDLTLWDASGNPVDYVAYGSGLAVDPPPAGLRWAGNLPPPPEGSTLALHPDGADQDGSEGWTVGSPTPGAPNGPSAEGASGSLDVLITEVYYNTFRDDETIALVNRGHSTVALEGWTIGDLLGSVAFPPNATLEPGQRCTLTANGTAYREDFLSQPDYTFGPGPGTPMVEGRTPLLSNEGDGVMLKDRWGRTVDALWYGRIVPTREGWTGRPALSLSRGQLATRRASAGALVDTNSSSDWDGPEVRTPGQIRRPLQWYPVQGRLRAFAAPDSSEEVFSEAIGSARRRIEVNAYEWEGGHLTELLVEALGRGVEVVLHIEAGLDGGPRGEAQLQTLARAGAHIGLMVNSTLGPGDRRYRLDHAKYLVVDNASVLVTSENFSEAGFPTAGRTGNRGWGVWVENATLAAALASVLATDWDPHHRDVQPLEAYRGPWGDDGGGSAAPFQRPVAPLDLTFETSVAPLLAPDHTLGPEGFLGLLQGARGSIDAELYYARGAEGNPYLQALMDAARRGVEVRLLLDGSRDGPGEGNEDVVRALNRRALDEELPLEAHLSPTAAPWLMIHNKGVVVDGRWTVVGSINWAAASMTLNREVALAIDSPRVASYFEGLFEDDWSLDPRGRAVDLGPDRTVAVGEAVAVTARGVEPGDRINWSLQGHGLAAAGATLNISFPRPGAYTVRVAVRDTLGHRSTAAVTIVAHHRSPVPLDRRLLVVALLLPLPSLVILRVRTAPKGRSPGRERRRRHGGPRRPLGRRAGQVRLLRPQLVAPPPGGPGDRREAGGGAPGPPPPGEDAGGHPRRGGPGPGGRGPHPLLHHRRDPPGRPGA